MFNEVVVKLTAVCNLNCSYCYMFNMQDRTHERVPKTLSLETSLRLIERVKQYIAVREPPRFTISLHGGEPFLWPRERFCAFLDAFLEARSRYPALRLCVQTNGLRMPPQEVLDRLLQAQASIGISLDGPPEIHDAHRKTHSGRGSYAKVIEVVRALCDGPHASLVGGFLSVMQTRIAPATYLEWVATLPRPSVDLIWPMDFNLDRPPWQDGGADLYVKRPRYGDWLAELFERWMRLGDPRIRIRLFQSLLESAIGGADRLHTDDLMNDAIRHFVVNTDGGIEYPDYLRVGVDGACRTGLDIAYTPIALLEQEPLFDQLLHLRDHLPADCRHCEHAQICGGGFLTGRTDGSGGFARDPSILCFDHFWFFTRANHELAHAMRVFHGSTHAVH